MAQHKSAKKRWHQNDVRKLRNRGIRTRMRTTIKEARAAIANASDNKDSLVKAALSEISRAASRNVLTKGTASRYMSRLMRAAR